jgi:hypothetical protein
VNERDLQDMRDAYEPTDSPKHPDFADPAADRADMDRKRAKESLPEPPELASVTGRTSAALSAETGGSESDLLRLKEAGFEVYGWVPMEADE